MSAELESWPRPHFVPGGGNPLLFYVIFGAFDLSRPLGCTKYRAAGVPEWLQLVSCDRAEQPEVFAGYQTGLPWGLLKRDQPLLAAEAERAPQCLIFRGEPADPPTLDYFRDAIGIV